MHKHFQDKKEFGFLNECILYGLKVMTHKCIFCLTGSFIYFYVVVRLTCID